MRKTSGFKGGIILSINTIAILSPGDMGHAVGQVLRTRGFDVIAYLRNRSQRTKDLANLAGIREVADMSEMVIQADLILSILVPEQALDTARNVANAINKSGTSVTFADCNAVSPETTKNIESVICLSGNNYVDASIIGNPPGSGMPTRIYVSGEHSAVMLNLDGGGIKTICLGDSIGQASAIKMCYAALTKGTFALYTAVLAAAEAMNLTNELRQEFINSQSDAYNQMEKQIPSLHTKAFRWIGEMNEIASSFTSVGVTPAFHQGAAEIYELISKVPFAHERPETIDTKRTLQDTIRSLTELL